MTEVGGISISVGVKTLYERKVARLRGLDSLSSAEIFLVRLNKEVDVGERFKVDDAIFEDEALILSC